MRKVPIKKATNIDLETVILLLYFRHLIDIYSIKEKDI